MGLCHGPIDNISRIKVDDVVLWEGTLSSGSLSINEPDLFGGQSREGGITGTLTLLKGTASQGVNSYLSGILGSLVPAFRRVASIVLQHMYLTMNPYMKPWSFFGQRILLRSDGSAQWQSSLAIIPVTVTDENGDNVTINAMNPIHMIRECLTDQFWGMGYNEADMDDTVFLAAAQTLHDEGLGLCMLWDAEQTIEDFVKEILRHIDAAVYVNRRTGKYGVKLIRADYTVGSLLTLDESNISELNDQKQLTFGELTNSITLKYHDVYNNNEASLSLQDIALIQAQGNEISASPTYPGIVDPTNAAKIAQRDLTALSSALFSCTVYTNQTAKDLIVGSVFKLNWSKLQINGMVMRVTEIAYGDGRDKKIRLKCVQDVFGYPNNVFIAPPTSGWTPVRTPPGAPSYQIAYELPYYGMIRESTQSAVDAMITENPDLGFVGVSAARGFTGGSAINAAVWTDSGTGYTSKVTADFAAAGVTTAALDYLDTTMTLTGYKNLDLVEVNTWFQIGDELCAVVDTSSSPTFTIRRGVLDTTPAQHVAGSVVMFWEDYKGVDPTEYVNGDSVDVKILPSNSTGLYPLADATPLNIEVVGRPARPFLPGQIKFDGGYYPDVGTIFSSDITMSWVHRNRKLQTGGTLIGFVDGTVTVEPGTTYEIRLYNMSDVLQYTYTGISGNSYVLPIADFGSISGGFMKVKLNAIRDGLTSFQTFEHTVTITNFLELEAGGFFELEDGSGFIAMEDGEAPLPPTTPLARRDSATGIDTLTMPTHAASDLLIAFGFRDGTTGSITTPTGDGWTQIFASSGSGCSFVLAKKTAASGSEPCGTFTGATGLIVVAISGGGTIAVGSNINDHMGLSTNIFFDGITLDVTDGSSMALAFAGHRSVNTTLETPPSPWTNFESYVDGVNEVAAHYIDNVTSVTTTNRSVGGTTAGYATVVLEIKH